MAESRPAVSAPEFWQDLYDQGGDGWELGQAPPPLASWLDAGGTFAPSSPGTRPRVAVPGCGRGHDARLLARHGYAVWGFDFAPAAIADAMRLAARDAVDVRFEQRDVFAAGAEYPGFFDAVWEYTCFCAIDPARRLEYAEVLSALLRPGGILLACFYPIREGSDGPPFPVRLDEIDRVLDRRFAILEREPPRASVERRRGLEWMVRAERRS